ncbi:MAG: UDP-glucose 4-epimerase GalE [Candidatus Endolissoclinum sp. TMED37]|nr:MAG: UDP-glucose 4-epimerase GalE [Candidatus Endolissoclinum sp. TMED37]|tara:strand:- start:350 stop:1357 length:1008 start_codon:yes stop_codon:yes gene_type:complete
MKFFITGGAGYIGSHTCVELLNKGYEVFVFDNLNNSSMKALDRVSQITKQKINFIKGDIRDSYTLSKTMEKFNPDIVVHFAGLKAVSESVLDPLKYFDVNVKGSIELLLTMQKIGCKHLIFSSSATVYGNPNYLPYDEKHSLIPNNPYGKSKLIIEQMIKDWVKSHNKNRAVCLRYFNPVGAHQTGLIGEDPIGIPNNLMPYISQVAVGKRDFLSIYGDNYDTRDGTGERDYIHVVDLAYGHVKVAEKIFELEPFQVLNLGTGKSTTVKELLSAFQKITGKKISFKIVNPRKGDIASSWADTSLVQNLLKIKFERSLEDMCQDAWNWQKKNPNGY